MIYALERLIRGLHRYTQRSHWLLKGLQPPTQATPCTGPKLLIIQIDGLGYKALQQALAQHKMPYLAQLIHRQSHSLQPLYSGLPSSTPAVQGELFYGIAQCVPAFGFLPANSTTPTHLLNTYTAFHLQQQLQAKSAKPLLQNGSSYCNLFTGGALEAHFCVADFRWNSGFNGHRVWRALVLMALNLPAVIRTLGLTLLEVALALYNALLGSTRLNALIQEFAFIPSRVAISILLRELTTLGVQMDIARGLPIIHANFLGYDEHAHRRGPQSAFALWSLKGIDHALKRLGCAAAQAPNGPYSLWLYSDHGQETALSYSQHTGQSLQDQVNRHYQALSPSPAPTSAQSSPALFSEHLARAQLIAAQYLPLKWPRLKTPIAPPPPCLAVAYGPLGFVYPPQPLNAQLLQTLAEALVKDAGIPWVFFRTQDSAQQQSPITALSASGRYYLPQQAEVFLGANHPYLKEACKDFIALCQHPLAGPLTLSGWQSQGPALTFGAENGAHGGPGHHECQGFLAVPTQDSCHFHPQSPQQPIRPQAIRQAALAYLAGNSSPATPSPQCLRVMTYNIHAALGMDGQRDYGRIAQVIAQYAPHIVALQEVWAPTTSPSPIALLSKRLEMTGYFHPLHYKQQGPFGLAVFSHLPLQPIKSGHYPAPWQFIPRQSRGLQWLQGQWNGQAFQLINTHFGLTLKEQRLQTQHLLSHHWLGQCQGPLIVCGDFNATPWHFAHHHLRQTLLDAQQLNPLHPPRNTFFSRFPSLRLDHIFISPHWQVHHTQVPHTPLTQVASDHLPLLVDLGFVAGDTQAKTEIGKT